MGKRMLRMWRENRPMCILGLLLLGLGTLILLWNLFWARAFHPAGVLLPVLSMALFIAGAVMRFQYGGERISVPLVAVFCLGLLPFGGAWMLFQDALTPTERAGLYPQVIAAYEKRAPFFPENIPEGAEQVRFYEIPGFGQGHGSVALLFTGDRETVEQYRALLEQNPVRTADPGEAPGEMPCPWAIKGVGLTDLSGFQLYYAEEADPSRPHGAVSGGAVDQNTGRVLLFYRDW